MYLTFQSTFCCLPSTEKCLEEEQERKHCQTNNINSIRDIVQQTVKSDMYSATKLQ